MGYYISNIDNQIHKIEDTVNYIIIRRNKRHVISILNDNCEEIDLCDYHETIDPLLYKLY